MLTEGNHQDNLDRTYIVLNDSELMERLATIVRIMSGRKTGLVDHLEEHQEVTDNTSTKKDGLWHCYCCGHSWDGYDKTNPDPPEKCSNCGRSDFRQARNLCKHDKNCNRCLKKKASLLELAEKLKAS